jgi:hypothetical protein
MQKTIVEKSLAAYFFVSVRPGLSSNEARCPSKNKDLVTAHCLRENRRQKGAILDMSQPRLKLVWVNGTWLSTQKKTKLNSSAETGKRAHWFIKAWTWLRLNGSAISAVVLLIGAPWYLGRLYVQLENADQALYGDAGLIKRVNGLQNDVIWVKEFVTGTYGEQVVAKGYKKDEVKILPVRFSEPQSAGKLLFQTAEATSARLQYNLEIALIRATREEIVLSVSREFGHNDFKNDTVKVPVTLGTVLELTEAVHIAGMPRIFLTVLSLPTQDTAILAIGSKESTRS